jgi:hypothetical protein
VEVTHTDFTKVTGMVLVEENPVVVHTSSITTTSWVLPVLADTSMASTDVPSLLPVLLEAGRHFLVRGVDISCLGSERRQRDQSERS